MFEEPIGGYTEDVGAALARTPAHRPGVAAQVTIPIVAASWTTWSPSLFTLDGDLAGRRLRWLHRSPEGGQAIADNCTGVWVTWYATSRRFAALNPSTVIGTTAEGRAMTAGQISAATLPGQAPITWDNESFIADGAPFGLPRPDTTDQWTHVLYTTWQMTAQHGGARLTDTVEIPRPRAGRRRDAREEITDPGTVRIVRVHSAHRPPRAAAEQDAAASTGRRAPQWSCRWPVARTAARTAWTPPGTRRAAAPTRTASSPRS